MTAQRQEGEYRIKKRGYWYRPNARGYTGYRAEAGLFSKDRAYADIQWPDTKDAQPEQENADG